jgi:hypothetical protein
MNESLEKNGGKNKQVNKKSFLHFIFNHIIFLYLINSIYFYVPMRKCFAIRSAKKMRMSTILSTHAGKSYSQAMISSSITLLNRCHRFG